VSGEESRNGSASVEGLVVSEWIGGSKKIEGLRLKQYYVYKVTIAQGGK